MKSKMRWMVLLLTCLLMFSGCGTPMYELTNEEEDLIVEGAAYLLSKHNIYKKDGANGTLPKKKEEPESEMVEEESESQKEDSTNKPSQGSDSSEPIGVSQGTVSLAETLGDKEHLQVSYQGFDVTRVYTVGSFFSLNAGEGNAFVVMKFQIANTGTEAVKLTGYENSISFYGIFDGKSKTPEKQTFITNSLSAFEGTIEAGEKAEAVLIFETGQEKADQLQEPKLQVKMNEKIYSVTL